MNDEDKLKQTFKILSDWFHANNRYHDHKETRAWASIVVLFVMTPFLLEASKLKNYTLMKAHLLTFLFAAIVCCVWKYVRIQLRLRREAAAKETIYMEIARELMAKTPTQFIFETNMQGPLREEEGKIIWPLHTKKFDARVDKKLEEKRDPVVKRLDCLANALIILISVAGLLFIWWPWLCILESLL